MPAAPAIAWTAAALVLGAESPKLLVLVVPADVKAAGLAIGIGKAATRQLASAQGVAATDLASALDPSLADERARDLREGLDAVARGMAAFEDLDLDTAGAELDTAVSLLLSHSDRLSAKERLSLDEALFTLGTAALFDGQGDQADPLFVALALFSPSFTPDIERYPSNVITRFSEIRATVDSRPAGEIEIVTNPAGAAVHVGGVFQGSTPLKIGGLPDGQHAVFVERPGYRSYGTLAPVTAGRPSRMEVDLEPTASRGLAESFSVSLAKNESSALALGRKLGVDRLAVLALEKPLSTYRVTGLWLDVKASKILARVEPIAVSNNPEVAAATLVGAIASAVATPAASAAPEASVAELPEGDAAVDEGEAEPETETEAETEGEPSEPLFTFTDPFEEKPWIWAVIGGAAAVVGASVAIAAAVSSGGPDRPPPSGHIFGF